MRGFCQNKVKYKKRALKLFQALSKPISKPSLARMIVKAVAYYVLFSTIG
jgi:hypothetical protein